MSTLVSLNAPYGARCFLTRRYREEGSTRMTRLNAPYGARCFLTETSHIMTITWDAS